MLQHESFSYNNQDLTNLLVNLSGCRRYTILYAFKQIRWRPKGDSSCQDRWNELRISFAHATMLPTAQQGHWINKYIYSMERDRPAGCSASLIGSHSVYLMFAHRPTICSRAPDDSFTPTLC